MARVYHWICPMDKFIAWTNFSVCVAAHSRRVFAATSLADGRFELLSVKILPTGRVGAKYLGLALARI